MLKGDALGLPELNDDLKHRLGMNSALRRQHAYQSLSWNLRALAQLVEADRALNVVAQGCCPGRDVA